LTRALCPFLVFGLDRRGELAPAIPDDQPPVEVEVELDPRDAQAAIERWRAITGSEARRG
jgi:hypothetical protein